MSGVDHTLRDHALLSASGANRWLNCPPSARLEEKHSESSQSIYAQEGTLAHEMAELWTSFHGGLISKKVFDSEMKRLRADELYEPDMETHVETYTNIVMEALSEARSRTKDPVLLVEERFDFSHIVPKGFGTGDNTIIADGVMEIIDLKYGKGVVVEADNNPQLMLYGLGALNKYDILYDINEVKLTIIQPRLDHYSTWSISTKELLQWGLKIVMPIAQKAYKGEGRKHAGEWCKFCKVKALCKEYADKNLDIARHEFKDPSLLSLDELATIYTQVPMLIDWANAVEKYLLDRALKGDQVNGYKIVEGRSNRKWIDEQKVIKVLEEEGYDEKHYLKFSLHGITAIEKLVSRANFPSMFGNLVVKPPGKPTLVPESDKRPAMGLDQAIQDFTD